MLLALLKSKIATQSLRTFVSRLSGEPKMSSISNVHIQVLGTGSNELGPSFYLFTDSKRYLFNAGENLQRFRHEFRPRLTNMSVFVTHLSWKNLGGFPGMVMSVRDQGVPLLNVYGPELIEKFTELTHYFVGRKKIQLVTPYSGDTDISYVCEDENVRITTVPLVPELLSTHLATPDAKRRRIENPGVINTAAFVCKLTDVRGKFDIAKAKALGLSRGPLYGKLQRGGNVISPDGATIYPHQVLGPTKKGPVIIVVECPDDRYISSVVSNSMLSGDSFRLAEQKVALVVHMSPADVVRDRRFQQWMSSFGTDTKHLMLHETLCSPEVALRRSLKIQFPLHLMNSSVYHSPVNTDSPSQLCVEFDTALKDSIIYGQTFLKYHLKPTHKEGLELTSTIQPLEKEYKEHLEHIASSKEMVEAIESSQSSVAEDKVQKKVFKIPANYLVPKVEDVGNPVITFLGTGSAAPTCYRTVSGILLRTASAGNFLLDCGEGSLSQIYRCFGKVTGDEIVRNLSGVFISHVHGDHHLGLPGVLVRKKELSSKVPFVIAPKVYLNWLDRLSASCQQLSFQRAKCEDYLSDTNPFKYKAEVSFQAVPVVHCHDSYGIVLRHSSGWSIVYSGDTRPCDALIEAGQNATLLIHEATFEDNLMEDAKMKLHSTFGEALKVSTAMNPKFTLMTHFSNRYPKVPSVLMDTRVHSKVGIALDCMSIGLKDLDTLYAHLPAMKQVFSSVIDTEDVEIEKSTTDWGDGSDSISKEQVL